MKENRTPADSRVHFKPGNMLYPVPAVMVSCGETDGVSDIVTVAWTGTVCTNPPMVYISLRPGRFSYPIIRDSGEFVINLVTEKLARAMDYCGVRSGRDTDKWKDCGLTKLPGETVKCPLIGESPVNIECRVVSDTELGSHHMLLAEVTAVQVDPAYLDGNGRLELEKARLLAYSHGTYYGLGQQLGTFGYSVRKKTVGKGSSKAAGATAGKARAGSGKAAVAAAGKARTGSGKAAGAAAGKTKKAPGKAGAATKHTGNGKSGRK